MALYRDSPIEYVENWQYFTVKPANILLKNFLQFQRNKKKNLIYNSINKFINILATEMMQW